MPRGRPQKEIDKKQFEKLCGLQCTLNEIAGYFDCDSKTLETWCKRTYNENFSDVFSKKRSLGKTSLRRYQFKLAEKSAAMAIFLGKNYLGQSDKIEQSIDISSGQNDDPLSASLKELAEKL